MERSEQIGLGVAIAGHIALFGALSLGLLTPEEAAVKATPIEVSLVDNVALESAAPPAPEPPAQSRAPEQGPPEDAAPAAPVPAEQPEPTPPAPQPKPAPPPKFAPNAPPKPKTPVAKPDKAKAPLTRDAKPATTKIAAAKASGSNPAATRARRTGSILDDDFRRGLTMSPSTSKAATPPGATMNAKAAADIASAILRQVQPCADRQVKPGPGAERIRVTIKLRLNRDGSLIGRPTITGHDGVDDENNRYVDPVDRLAIATFTGCSPLRGLPTDLYDVPRGWSTFSLRYKLPG